jgi:hypothetical protein
MRIDGAIGKRSEVPQGNSLCVTGIEERDKIPLIAEGILRPSSRSRRCAC